MAFQISKLDLTDIAVLKDQLTGVDAAYFMSLVSTLEKTKADGREIDLEYVTELINEIF